VCSLGPRMRPSESCVLSTHRSAHLVVLDLFVAWGVGAILSSSYLVVCSRLQNAIMSTAYGSTSETGRIVKMCTPKPRELKTGTHRFIREGPILQWNPKERRHKPKYACAASPSSVVSSVVSS
jgi:hypothetical protein